MSRFLLTARIAILFALLVTFALVATLFLFVHVAGHDLFREIHSLHAYQGIDIVLKLEAFLDSRQLSLDDSAVARWLDEEAQERQLILELGGKERPEDERWQFEVEIQERTCWIDGPPRLGAWVPIFRDGGHAAWLQVRGKLHRTMIHNAFTMGLLQIGGVTLIAILTLAVYLTAPLRRMSRSMDRIAAGELEHRVTAQGRDEVAVMGRSFNAMADRIRDMVTGQKELMAGVSHELRSPLARMKVSLELLRQAGGQGDRITDLETDVDAIDELVGELLLASRLELGADPLRPETLELGDVAREAWQRVAEDAADLGMTLVIDTEAGAECLAADRALTIRLLGNLFENAVRYARSGKVTVRARPLEHDDERMDIAVVDEGPGSIDSAHLERLFEPFYRVDSSRSRQTGAGGLGLMIVRRIVEAHGGTVRAQAIRRGGLAVVFDLPRSREA